MGNLFSSHLASDAGAPEANVSGGLPLSEADGMPSLSGMSPSDAAAFLQSTKKASLVSVRPSYGWCTSVGRHMQLRILKMPASTLRAAMTRTVAVALTLSFRDFFISSMIPADACSFL